MTKRRPSDPRAISKGALGGLAFTTDDARALYEKLRERGVTDFTEEPTEHFYGIDMGVRHPFGTPSRFCSRKTSRSRKAPKGFTRAIVTARR